ncbi:MAG: hypothetical protein GY895_00415 [Phycisphaera sp.]|nr:hypothetical protein [Phycisphaera sp.]
MNNENLPAAGDDPDFGRVADDAVSIPPDLVELDSRLEETLRSAHEVDADRADSLASSVFAASVGSLPNTTASVETYPIADWRRRFAGGLGLAAAASVAVAAWIGFQSTPRTSEVEESPRIAATESELGAGTRAEFELEIESFGGGDSLLVSIDSPTGPEALLAAVMMGGDSAWLDDAPAATLAVQNVRPVLDSWSIDVTDVEAEIQSILAGPTS